MGSGESVPEAQGVNVAMGALAVAPPVPAVTFAPVSAASGAMTLLKTVIPPAAANDESIGLPQSEDIIGIVSITNLPARKPLQMEAAAPVYLRPRDALTGLHRLLSAAWTT